MNTKQIARIQEMEQRLNRSWEAIDTLKACLEQYRQALDDIRALEHYLSSPQWRQDYEDDEGGQLPQELRRGVLSQDAISNLLGTHQSLLYDMALLINANSKQQQ